MVIQVSTDYCDPEELNMPTADTNGGHGHGSGVPRASLICRPNSHPFQDRMLGLDQPVKVGRSVARAKPLNTNAIFDCKVLSRNHALLWYENGKFYLQDTKSSNGTFVNNQRLSKGSEESPAREVCSGDILQFGVDVMENSRKVTHGCIIATLKLFLPDGKEAKASPSIVNSSPGSSIPAQDLYQLNQYIQESLAREQLLEAKLLGMQRLVEETEAASQLGWKALMDEERLLTRVEILESQLTTYGKSMSEDKLREETKRLMEEKEMYQNSAKDTLKKIVDDKLDAVNKLNDVELSLTNLEAEFSSLRQLYDKSVEENKKLSEKLTTLSEDLNKKNKETEVNELNSLNDMKSELSESLIKKSDLYITGPDDSYSENGNDATADMTETNGKYCEEESDLDKTDNEDIMSASTDSLEEDQDLIRNRFNVVLSQDNTILGDMTDPVKMMEETTRLRNLLEEINRSKVKTDHELVNLRINLEEAKNENSTVLQELENTRNKLADAEQLISSQDKLVKDLEDKVQENSHRQDTDRQVSTLDKSLNTSQTEDSAVTDRSQTDSSVTVRSQTDSAVTDRSQTDSAISPDSSQQTDPLIEEDLARLTHECKLLQDMVQKLEEANANLQEDCLRKDSHINKSANVSNAPGDEATPSSVASSSNEAVSQLQDQLVSVKAEKEKLVGDVSKLEEELSIIAVASRTLTACTVIPIIVLLIAVVMAFLPSISSLFGTRDF